MARKKNEQDPRSMLTATQEVLYQREFKRADKAGGYNNREAHGPRS